MMNEEQSKQLQQRSAQWERAQGVLESERIARLRGATEVERMAERMLIFADVNPNAAWISNRMHSGLVEQQVLLRSVALT